MQQIKIFKTKLQQQKIIQQQRKFSNLIKSKNCFYKLSKQAYVVKTNKHTAKTFKKKLVVISKNKIKGKSKCAICSTERTFIHKTESKYDLESELEIYFQFFTD